MSFPLAEWICGPLFPLLYTNNSSWNGKKRHLHRYNIHNALICGDGGVSSFYISTQYLCVWLDHKGKSLKLTMFYINAIFTLRWERYYNFHYCYYYYAAIFDILNVWVHFFDFVVRVRWVSRCWCRCRCVSWWSKMLRICLLVQTVERCLHHECIA